MKVLITGDRNWTDRGTIRSWLCKLQDWGYDTVVQGGARGADTIAKELARELRFSIITYPAQWDKYHRAAGPIRNRTMFDTELPHLVVAFHHDISQSKGTKDMVNYAISKGYKPIIVTGQ